MTSVTGGNKRCGCDCRNETEFERADLYGETVYDIKCCENCPDGAASAYGVLFECNWQCGGIKVGPYWNNWALSGTAIVGLYKACLFDCKWEQRWCLREIVAPGTMQPYCQRGPLIGNPWGTLNETPCGVPTGEDPDGQQGQYFPPMWIDSDQKLHYAPLPFKCARSAPIASPTSPYNAGPYDFYDLDDYETGTMLELANEVDPQWVLEVLSDRSATLTGYMNYSNATGAGIEVVYTCDVFECGPLDADGNAVRNTFTMEGDHPPLNGYGSAETNCWELPKNVCVVPIASQWRTPCDTAEAACACKDAGWTEGHFDIVATGCGSINGTRVILTRNAELPACITAPSPAPCGYFYNGNIISNGAAGSLKMLVWCDGTDWQYEFYCGDSTTCTLVCSGACTMGSYCPAGATLTIDNCDGGDCCPDPPPGTIDTECCPDNLLPETLTGELSPDPAQPTHCPGYDQSGSLTHYEVSVGPAIQHFWSGSIDDCGTTYEVLITCDGSTWKAKVWEPAGTCMENTTEASTVWSAATSVSCDPFELGFASFNSAVIGCDCCTGDPPYAFMLTVTA